MKSIRILSHNRNWAYNTFRGAVIFNGKNICSCEFSKLRKVKKIIMQGFRNHYKKVLDIENPEYDEYIRNKKISLYERHLEHMGAYGIGLI